jgi:hypothetical protein
MEVRNAGYVGNSVDIVSIFAEPLRAANDLFGVDPVGDQHDGSDGYVNAGDVVASGREAPPLVASGSLGLMVATRKSGLASLAMGASFSTETFAFGA